MSLLSYTLVTDGRSDQVLIHPIHWVLQQATTRDFEGEWADPNLLQASSRRLEDRLPVVIDRYPCDVLFVHRDAEREPMQNRVQEIKDAVSSVTHCPPAVCVVPVRMTEAWLLFDEAAIRKAADHPRGRDHLDLPLLNRLESEPDPKKILRDAILGASGYGTRRRQKLEKAIPRRHHRVAELIEDWGQLRQLSAFAAFESEVRSIILERGWEQP